MRSTKLYQILSSFTKIEQNRLRKFVQSPFFNPSQALVQLFEYLIEDINQNAQTPLEKEDIWNILEPESSYDDVRFRKYNSDLLKLVENFLSQEVLEENKIAKSILLLEALKKRKLDKLFSSSIRTARKLLEENPVQSAEIYLYKYQVEKNFYELSESELKRGVKSNIETISDYLDTFYIAEKLKYYSAAVMQQQIVKLDYEISFVDSILKWLSEKDFNQIPSIALYHQILKTTIDSENIEYYDDLKKLLSRYWLSFPKSEATTLYYAAVNYCIKKINSGKTDFYKELFDIYREMVENEIVISEKGEVSPWDFKNIVLIGLNSKEFDWTENFIQKFGPIIQEPYRENAVTFNLGQLYFYQKKYEKVLDQLRNVEYDDITYSLNSKIFLVWSFFELDESELLYSQIESFRTFINRHKEISSARRKPLLNFLKFVKKLSWILPGDKKALDKIKGELDKIKGEGVVGINWIQEKIETLEK